MIWGHRCSSLRYRLLNHHRVHWISTPQEPQHPNRRVPAATRQQLHFRFPLTFCLLLRKAGCRRHVNTSFWLLKLLGMDLNTKLFPLNAINQSCSFCPCVPITPCPIDYLLLWFSAQFDHQTSHQLFLPQCQLHDCKLHCTILMA